MGTRPKICGARRDRTVDLLHAMQALSQLSYGPVEGRELSGTLPGLSTTRFERGLAASDAGGKGLHLVRGSSTALVQAGEIAVPVRGRMYACDPPEHAGEMRAVIKTH